MIEGVSMKNRPKILVCVTRQKTCERLIEAGSVLAKEAHAPLSVVHVEKPGVNLLGNPSESEALEYLFQVSHTYEADMTVIRKEDVIDTLVEFVRTHEITTMVMGRAPVEDSENTILNQLRRKLPDVDIRVV